MLNYIDDLIDLAALVFHICSIILMILLSSSIGIPYMLNYIDDLNDLAALVFHICSIILMILI